MGECCAEITSDYETSFITKLKWKFKTLYNRFKYRFGHSNTYLKAVKEFDILEKSYNHKDLDKRPVILDFKKEILAVVEKFGKSGQSGRSAPFYAHAISSAIKDLCMHDPLYGITGEDWEWNDVSIFGDGSRHGQNNRLGSVFKEEGSSRSYYIDAIVFKDQNGSTFTSGNNVILSNGDTVGSAQYIKSFPFRQKTFYIDVIATEWADKEEKVEKPGGSWWTFKIKDESQLKDVFEYYDKKSKHE